MPEVTSARIFANLLTGYRTYPPPADPIDALAGVLTAWEKELAAAAEVSSAVARLVCAARDVTTSEPANHTARRAAA